MTGDEVVAEHHEPDQYMFWLGVILQNHLGNNVPYIAPPWLLSLPTFILLVKVSQPRYLPATFSAGPSCQSLPDIPGKEILCEDNNTILWISK